MQYQTDHSEEWLLKNLREGNVEAFAELFRKYWRRFYIIARSKIHSHEEAEEIVQHIFSTLWEKRETLLINELSFYLHAAVRNHVINIIRSRIRQRKYWEYYKQFIGPRVYEVSNDAVLSDLHAAVEQAVNHLPEKSRKVFKLSRIEGRSNAEIASLLQVSEKAIEYHLTKSLRKLRVHLKDYTITGPVTGFFFLALF